MAGRDGVTYFTSLGVRRFLAQGEAGNDTVGTAGQVLKSGGPNGDIVWGSVGTVALPVASSLAAGIVSTGTQSFPGNKTFINNVAVNGNAQIVGTLNVTGAATASNLSGTNTGDVTISTANGLSLAGQALSMAAASTSATGTITTGSQLIAGSKTLISNTTLGTQTGGGSSSSNVHNVLGRLQINSTPQADALYFKGGPGGAGSTAGVAFDATGLAIGLNVSARINFVDDGAYGANTVFENRTGGLGTTTTERMRIQTNGRIGIGNSSPTSQIDISGTNSGGTIRIFDQTASTGSTREIIREGAGQSTTKLTEWQANNGTVVSSVSKTGEYNYVAATASTAAVFDSSKNLISSAVTSTELGYVSGVTSAIQTQFTSKITNPGVAGANSILRSNSVSTLVWSVGPTSRVRVEIGNGYGSTNNKIRRYTTTVVNTGSDITYTDSAANGGSFTINTPGIYTINMGDESSVTATYIGISNNSNQLTTAIDTITNTARIAIVAIAPGGTSNSTGVTLRLATGDVIRHHTDATANGTSVRVWFDISKIGY